MNICVNFAHLSSKKGGSNDIPYAVIKTVPDNVPAGEPDRQKKYKEPKVPFKDKFRTSLIINIVLVIVVAIMFAIALSSSNPNIINYEGCFRINMRDGHRNCQAGKKHYGCRRIRIHRIDIIL